MFLSVYFGNINNSGPPSFPSSHMSLISSAPFTAIIAWPGITRCWGCSSFQWCTGQSVWMQRCVARSHLERWKTPIVMGVSRNRGIPKSSYFNRVSHYIPSILRYPYFWKHPNETMLDANRYNLAISGQCSSNCSSFASRLLFKMIILKTHWLTKKHAELESPRCSMGLE